MKFGLLSLAFMLPFAALGFYQHSLPRGVVITLLCLALGLNSYRASRRRPLVISQESLYILMLVAISIGFQEVSLVATFWCYPLPLYFLFTVRKQLSNLVAGTWLLFVTIQCFARLDIAIAIRVSLTLALVMLMGRTYVSMIDELRESLRKQAFIDPLTGLYNRNTLHKKLVHCRERLNRGQEKASICLLDIDHFKRVNDLFGHQEGDVTLQKVAHTTLSRMRKIDDVFRFGGEEFLVLLSNADASEAAAAGESLRALIEDECERPDGVPVTVSIGIAELEAGESIQSWLHRADLALYEAKNTGRNRVAVAPPNPASPALKPAAGS
ncbi:MAG TPA: GGDEF domain-containing protein [Phycisphaerales bacterium]|nr:GGDEF domain-containing protein [Phycisphaerales bacterium]